MKYTQNIIIAGTPRSGKTILAKRIHKAMGYSLMPADAIVSSFGQIFPKHGISHYEEHGSVCATFEPFFLAWIEHLRYENFAFVIDVYHVTPQSLAALKDRDCVVCLGYPTISPELKCTQIRHYANPQDWTTDLSDLQLRQLVERYINQSQQLEQSCKELGIPFADTGTDFQQSIQATFERVQQRCQKK
ncbi:MAG: hypothetical protein AAF639_01100 [Chloroflexota bacterium]